MRDRVTAFVIALHTRTCGPRQVRLLAVFVWICWAAALGSALVAAYVP